MLAVRVLLAVGVATVASGTSRPSAAGRPWPRPERADTAYVRQHYVKREYRLPMRDGVELFTAVYAPRDASPTRRYPILMTRTPFSIAPYGADAYPQTLGPDEFTLHDGYIFVYQDVRGRYMSGGIFENVRPLVPDAAKRRDPRLADEATDTYDTIAWLLAHTAGNNGRVGIWGISYGGFYAVQGV